MSTAMIIGSQGQDGRLLATRLRAAGHRVVGLTRHGVEEPPRPDLAYVQLGDAAGVAALVDAVRPETIYYLAAHHHSAEAQAPEPLELFSRSHEVHVAGWLHVLEAARRTAPEARLFYAASSHVFGHPAQHPQDEATPLAPTCAYGITKTAGVHCARHYRRQHGLFVAAGILFNHESPLRGAGFLSRKVTRGAVEVAAGQRQVLVLGDLEARVDWGYAPDHVDAMIRILALDEPDDFVVATGVTHSIEDLVARAFARLGLDWRAHVKVDPRLVRKERRLLVGDASRLRARTGWAPTVDFDALVDRLVDAETRT